MSEVQVAAGGVSAGGEGDVAPRMSRPPTRSETAWYEFFDHEGRRSVEISRDAAKVVLQAVGILAAVYFGALSIRPEQFKANPTLAVSPILCWCLALVLALIVLVPWRWRARENVAAEIKERYLEMGRRKQALVIAAGACVTAGLTLGAVVIVVGLRS